MKRLVKLNCFFALCFLMISTAADTRATCWQDGLADLTVENSQTDWFRMDGDRPMLKVRGEVFLPDGSPADNISVVARIDGGVPAPDVTVSGNRFSFETAGLHFGPVYLTVATADGQFLALPQIAPRQLRSAAINGLQVNLKRARTVRIKALANGVLVADTDFELTTSFGRFVNTSAKAQDDTAEFLLAPGERVTTIIAVSSSHGVGGELLHSQSPERQLADEFIVELTPVREMRVRFVDEKMQPVENVAISFYVSSQVDNDSFRFHATNQDAKSDANGIATFQQFPQRENLQYSFYPLSDKWQKVGQEDGEDEVVVRLKPVLPWARKTVNGRVSFQTGQTDGIAVTLQSFQAPSEEDTDYITTRVRPDGTFSADVYEGATYVVYVDDETIVSQPFAEILFDPKTNKQNLPDIEAIDGVPLAAHVSAGKNGRPMADVLCQYSTTVEYEYVQNGETKSARSGPYKAVRTDATGVARMSVIPGKVTVQIFDGEWRSTQKVEAVAGQNLSLNFRRPDQDKHAVAGRLKLLPGADAVLEDARVEVYSVDGETTDSAKTVSAADGSFSTECSGTKVGVYVVTADQRAAGIGYFEEPHDSVELELLPTTEFVGKVIDQDKKPVADYPVRLVVHLGEYGWRKNNSVRTLHYVDVLEARTDAGGNFKITGVPLNVTLARYGGSLGNSRFGDEMEGQMIFKPGEVRKSETFPIERNPGPE